MIDRDCGKERPHGVMRSGTMRLDAADRLGGGDAMHRIRRAVRPGTPTGVLWHKLTMIGSGMCHRKRSLPTHKPGTSQPSETRGPIRRNFFSFLTLRYTSYHSLLFLLSGPVLAPTWPCLGPVLAATWPSICPLIFGFKTDFPVVF